MPFGKPSEDVDAWHFPADITPEQVVDGDTTSAYLDLGMRVYRRCRLRLYGVDTAEIFGTPRESEEFIRGQEHNDFVESWVRDARETGEEWPFSVWTKKDQGLYSRWIADVSRQDTGESLTDALREEFPEL